MAEERNRNEGEGSRTAAREYNEKTTEFARSGKVEKQARAAARMSEQERREAEDAAEQGRARSKEEDPAVSGRGPHAKP